MEETSSRIFSQLSLNSSTRNDGVVSVLAFISMQIEGQIKGRPGLLARALPERQHSTARCGQMPVPYII